MIAAAAQKHFVVSKIADSVSRSMVTEVEGEARVREVARMTTGNNFESSAGLAGVELAKALLGMEK